MLTEILLPAAAEPAGLGGLVEPRHADAVAGHERRRARLAAGRVPGAGPERRDLADDLMTGDDRRAVRRQLALEDVQVGTADAAGADTEQHLSRTGLGDRQLDELERPVRRRRRSREAHRAHGGREAIARQPGRS